MKKLFFSYAHKNSEFANKIKLELERMGFHVWQDVGNLRSGLNWETQIIDAVANTDIMLVLLSKASVKSKYVRQEWLTALTNSIKIIPLLLEKCTIPKDLQKIQYIDFSDTETYSFNLATLIRDLIEVKDDKEKNIQTNLKQKSGNDSIQIGNAGNISIKQNKS